MAMNNLPANLQDTALIVGDAVECLLGERRHNADMIAIAIVEGIRAAKTKTDLRTNGDWADAMCSLGHLVQRAILAS